jgi:hypothetical protein
MGRKYKLSPSKKPKAKPGAVAKRAVAEIKRKRAQGKKVRVKVGSAAARALGIK